MSNKSVVATRIGVSALPGCGGLHGVMLDEAVTTHDREQLLAYYPGLLVTEALFNRFAEQYYCPTALGLPALAWAEAGNREPHNMLIIGDPTCTGAIINDGVRSGLQGTLSTLPAACTSTHFARLTWSSLYPYAVQPTAC